ncbi:DNA polymerase Y family protein [Butyrivibrio sp. LC3010]|uniref:DNA polymerase Y family protein n=1 Tax=Butyrivibrio sp. LC3010 TaxID=1280680 RepID=UPI0006777E83|nr:DNA polymerase IV [Butyrivibrio sp. LC3010]
MWAIVMNGNSRRKIIFHIDVNSAFLSWTAVKRLKEDPDSIDLRTIPSVVGGDIKTRHGIVTAKSIPAKKYGINTAEPITSALQKCPKLVVVPSDFKTYREYSHAFIDILRSYSEILEQVSIDEAFLDVTGLSSFDVKKHLMDVFSGEASTDEDLYTDKTSIEEAHADNMSSAGEKYTKGTNNVEESYADGTNHVEKSYVEGTKHEKESYVDGPGNGAESYIIRNNHAEDLYAGRKQLQNKIDSIEGINEPFPICLAAAIRYEIRTKLGFTVNVGISTNKLLAKMASDFTKPDKTHTLYLEEIQDKMWGLDIGDLFGCGKKSAEKLRGVGIRTIGEAATADMDLLKSQLGEKSGDYIKRSANGIGSDTVHPEREDAKSYSNETTMTYDITAANYDQDMPPVVRYLSEKVSGRLKRDGVYGGTVTAQVKTNDFKRFSRQIKLSESTDNADVIYDNAMFLLGNLLTGENGLFEDDIGIRLVGVGVDNLDNGEYRQVNLFDWATTGQAEIKKEKELNEKQEKLVEMERLIKGKFGDDAISKGL